MSADLSGVPVWWTQQTNLALASATLNGIATNYVKVRYNELDGNTRARAKSSGTYAYETVPSFTFVVDTVAPTIYDLCLTTFVGTAGGAFTFKTYPDHRFMIKDESTIEGKSLKILDSYTAISTSHPWLCLSLPDVTLTATNYSASFIAERRSRKIVYDELNTKVSAFGGTWSSNVFTLTNNAANNAMIAELAEDWLFAGSPATNWRILNDGTNEFNITGISASAITITVNLDSKTAAGTSISIYLYRVYGSTTSCRHFSWAGLGLYMTGQNKITGLRRRDKFQGHLFQFTYSSTGYGSQNSFALGYQVNGSISTTINAIVTDGTNGTPRPGPKTEMESATALLYLYIGAYTA
jgi:hypothetical protein